MVKVAQQHAQVISITHPSASWGIFCFNDIGDLFLNSDWGSYCYAWRAYGDSFKEFLAKTEAEYIVQKFGINYMEHARKRMPKHLVDNVTILVEEFIKYMKENIAKKIPVKLTEGELSFIKSFTEINDIGDRKTYKGNFEIEEVKSGKDTYYYMHNV